VTGDVTARSLGLVACRICGKVHRSPPAGLTGSCVRCGSRLHSRKPASLQRTWALLLTGILLYVPANIYPIMTTEMLGRPEDNTIIQGVVVLWHHRSYFIAVVVFIASVMVPVLKFLVLSYLLASVERGAGMTRRDKLALFHVTEIIGPWSMVDVFVVALLVALIQMGGIATVRPGVAAFAFAGMVAVTMLAASAFDPRLLWDDDRTTS
jgi:paraquat-inducible protein A